MMQTLRVLNSSMPQWMTGWSASTGRQFVLSELDKDVQQALHRMDKVSILSIGHLTSSCLCACSETSADPYANFLLHSLLILFPLLTPQQKRHIHLKTSLHSKKAYTRPMNGKRGDHRTHALSSFLFPNGISSIDTSMGTATPVSVPYQTASSCWTSPLIVPSGNAGGV